MQAEFHEHVREWLKVPWREHAALERVTIRGPVVDGDVLVGDHAGKPLDQLDTTFFGDMVVTDMIVTGFEAKGANVAVTLGTETVLVHGDHRLDKPMLLARGTKIGAVVRDDDPSNKSVSLTFRGYELLHGMLPDVKMVVEELYAS